jgi:signal recognition particle receptor subunit beta
MDKVRPLWRRCQCPSHAESSGTSFQLITPLTTDYWNAHAFIFALDAAAPERFAEARVELDRMHSDSGSESYPLLVLANKMDLPQAESLATIAEALGAERFPKWGRPVVVKVGVGHFTSAGKK